MRRNLLLGFLSLFLVANFGGCSDPAQQGGSETHFLRDCAEGCGSLDCICGVCTRLCDEDAKCNTLATRGKCTASPKLGSCGTEEPPAMVCDVECQKDSDCDGVAGGALCSVGRCRAASSASAPLSVTMVMQSSAPECFVREDPSFPHLLGGTLDVLFSDAYDAILLVRNDLSPGPDNSVTLHEANVSLTDGRGIGLIEFSVPIAGFVDGARHGLTQVVLVPQSQGGSFSDSLALFESASITANVRVSGDTSNGEVVASQTFTFPIEICKGCLVRLIPEVDNPATPGYECNATGSVGAPPVENVCALGQNDPVDCRVCCASFAGNPDYDAACACPG